jgi:aminodeoxyfutalosine deaminase
MGIPPDGLAAALTAGRSRVRDDHGVELAWVFDIPGELGLASGERTIDWVERWAPEGCVGFGLGGPELGVARPQFAEVFAQARALGLHSVPHAGETTGPATIWDALHHLGAERIGHGITAVADPALIQHLLDHYIPLEVCPSSNVRTRAVPALSEHPMPRLIAAGVLVTLGSDDPGMFDTTLNAEYRTAHDVFGMSTAQLADLSRTGIEVSYADPARKQQLRR